MGRFDEYGRNTIDPQDLDRHITGNWGEDSVADDDAMECPECGSCNTRFVNGGSGIQADFSPVDFANYECLDCGNDWSDC